IKVSQSISGFFTGWSDRQRQNRSLSTNHATGAETGQAGFGAGAGNWSDPANHQPFPVAFSVSYRAIAFRPKRYKTSASLAGSRDWQSFNHPRHTFRHLYPHTEFGSDHSG